MITLTKSGVAAIVIAASSGAAFAAAHVENALDTAAQSLSHSVVVKSVTAAQDGWIVIHKMQDGKPVVPTSIGHTYINAGTTTDVYIPLTEGYDGDTVIAMLHSDDGDLGVYQFGADSTEFDKPVAVDGNVVVAPIKIEK
jgi:hypothetical protein